MTIIHVAGFELLADEWDAIMGDLADHERAVLSEGVEAGPELELAYDSYEVVLEAIPGL